MKIKNVLFFCLVGFLFFCFFSNCVSLSPPEGVESSSDVALYSGLAAGVVTVVLLVVAVTLYRRSQSEYGVDVIDSSALTGGFQSFSFKSSRQGELPLAKVPGHPPPFLRGS